MKKQLILLAGLIFIFPIACIAQDKINPRSELIWDAPTTNEDGSPLTDLAGYRIGIFNVTDDPSDPTVTPLYIYGVLGSSTTQNILTTLQTGGFPDGVYRVAVLAYDEYGNESLWSNYIDIDIKTVKPNSPKNPQTQKN